MCAFLWLYTESEITGVHQPFSVYFSDQIPAWLVIMAAQKHRLLFFLIDLFTAMWLMVNTSFSINVYVDNLLHVSGNDHYQLGYCQSNHATCMFGHLSLHFRFVYIGWIACKCVLCQGFCIIVLHYS